MVHWSIAGRDSSSPFTLQAVIDHELEQRRRQLQLKSISIELDVGAKVGGVACSTSVRAAIQHLLDLSISRSPTRGELLIAACQSCRGLEIEIADSGDELEFPRFSAFQPRDCRQLLDIPQSRADVDFFCAQCPQGGMAWTIVVNHRQAISRAA